MAFLICVSIFSVQFSSVAQACPTLCDPMNCSTPGLPVHHQLPGFAKLMSIKSVMPSSHLILCCSLLLLPAILPSIRVFSSESSLRIRWPEYWSFSFSISPSNEHQGPISFRIKQYILIHTYYVEKELAVMSLTWSQACTHIHTRTAHL